MRACPPLRDGQRMSGRPLALDLSAAGEGGITPDGRADSTVSASLVIGGLVLLDERLHPRRILLLVPVTAHWCRTAAGLDDDIREHEVRVDAHRRHMRHVDGLLATAHKFRREVDHAGRCNEHLGRKQSIPARKSTCTEYFALRERPALEPEIPSTMPERQTTRAESHRSITSECYSIGRGSRATGNSSAPWQVGPCSGSLASDRLPVTTVVMRMAANRHAAPAPGSPQKSANRSSPARPFAITARGAAPTSAG